MRVYKLQSDIKRYSTFAVAGKLRPDFYGLFDGRSLARDWETVTMIVADEDQDDATIELPDFTLLGVVPVFSVRAATTLLPLLKPNGELLPVRHPRAEYLLYNVTHISDALDESASTVERFSSGRIMTVEKYVFKASMVVLLDIFKVPQFRRGSEFVTDRFVTEAQKNNLTGFDFRLIWEG